MKVYISLPITGIDMRLVRFNAEQARRHILMSQHQPVSPLELNPDPTRPYPEMMGRDIQALLECDAIYFCRGWESSRGCQAEYQVARIYGKILLFE